MRIEGTMYRALYTSKGEEHSQEWLCRENRGKGAKMPAGMLALQRLDKEEKMAA